VSDVLLKNTLTTIEEFNENMYVRVDGADKILKLDRRNYNVLELALHIAAKPNTVVVAFRGMDDVYNSKVLIDIDSSHTFRIFTDEELKLNNMNWTGEWYDKYNLKSVNSVMGNYGVSKTHDANSPFLSGRISLQPLDYVLLSSFGLGYTSYGSREGERHIVKKIPLAPYGELTAIPFFDISDSIPVHTISLTRLKFVVTDPYGNAVDLHGSNISFSLLFIHND